MCIINVSHLPECNMCQHVRLFPFIFMKICAQKMFNIVHGYKELDHQSFNYEKNSHLILR